MPQKIAILKNRFDKIGGLEKQTLLIANKLIQKNHNLSIITSKQNDNIPLKASFYFIKKIPFFSFLKIFFFNQQAKKIILKQNFDIVLGIDRTTFQTHIRAGNGVHRSFLEKRKIYESKFKYYLCKINPLHRLILKYEKKAFENKDLKTIFVNSKMVKDEILKYYKVEEKKITIIHNGIDIKKSERDFKNSFLKREEILKNLNLDPNKFYFLFIGNDYKRKGLLFLLKAAANLQKDFHILIIGKDKNIKKYKKISKILNLQNKTTFLGPKKDISKYYQIADVCTILSTYDPFANTTIEALSMGLFCITSKENGGSEIINNQNGYIVNNLLNIDEIKKALLTALNYKKTFNRAIKIRNSIKYLNIDNQINKLIDHMQDE